MAKKIKKRFLIFLILFVIVAAFVVGTTIHKRLTCLKFELNEAGNSYILVGYDESGIPSEVEIPATYKDLPVTEIADRALHSAPINQVTIPSTITIIGKSAFAGSGLTQIEIPDSVRIIDSSAFENCSSLSNVIIGEGVEKIGDEAFLLCANDMNVTLGNNVTSIGEGAFVGCAFNEYKGNKYLGSAKIEGQEANPYYALITGYTNPTIHPSTRIIADHAFEGSSITSVEIPDSVTHIGESSFYSYQLEYVKLGSNLLSIGKSAFFSQKLTSISIPKGVKFIGAGAFICPEDLRGLSIYYEGTLEDWCHVTLESSLYSSKLVWNEDARKWVTVETTVYIEGYNADKIVVPESIFEIKKNTFISNKSLKYIVIHESVLSIEKEAFPNNTTIYYMGNKADWAKITIPNNAYDKNPIFYYSEELPTDNLDSYWHYNDFGEIVLWETDDAQND